MTTFKQAAYQLLEEATQNEPVCMKMASDYPVEDTMTYLREFVVPCLDDKVSEESRRYAVSTLFATSLKCVMKITGKSVVWLIYEMAALYERKNHDYGNVWESELDMFGIIALRLRMWEKTNRAVTILDNPSGQLVTDEKVLDTIIDICNYCVMTAMWMMNKE